MEHINNTKKDKVIKFLAMGSDLIINNEKLNHRFRTTFTNKKNERFFIEFSLFETTKHHNGYLKDSFQLGDYIFHIDFLFRSAYIDSNNDPDFSRDVRSIKGLATKRNMINYINETCDCDFEDLEVIDNIKINYDTNTSELL